MKSGFPKSTNPLIAKIDQLFNRDLALENDYLRQENRILRSKFGRRVPLTEADRRILVKYGLRIKDRLREIVAIAKPETPFCLVSPAEEREVDVPKATRIMFSNRSVLASLNAFIAEVKALMAWLSPCYLSRLE